MKIVKEFYTETKVENMNNFLIDSIRQFAGDSNLIIGFEIETGVDFIEKKYKHINTLYYSSETVKFLVENLTLNETINSADIAHRILRNIAKEDREHFENYHPYDEYVTDGARYAFSKSDISIIVRVLKSE